MNTKIEIIPSYRIAYMRNTGPYGYENAKTMECLKNWVGNQGLYDQNSVILGIAQDDPNVTNAEECRYDACFVISDEEIDRVDIANVCFGTTMGGKYYVFTLEHTAAAVQRAWLEMLKNLSDKGYQLDFSRPVIERYKSKMVENHLCEICVPVY